MHRSSFATLRATPSLRACLCVALGILLALGMLLVPAPPAAAQQGAAQQGAAQRGEAQQGAAPRGGERPVRLGLHHARPHLCLADEPTQRDLRVLRLGFGIDPGPAQRLAWPWFYRARPRPERGPTQLELELDTAALWGRPLVRLLGAHPDLPQAGGDDRLAPWRRWSRERLPALRPAEIASVAAFLAPLPASDPFFASRLAGSALLPFELGRTGTRPSDVCRHWPEGTIMQPGDETFSYMLRGNAGGSDGGRDASAVGDARPGGPFVLYAYREEADLWRDYFRGRLDALLLEGADFDGRLQRYRASQLGPWGVQPGTQQLVLRLQPELARTLGREGRMALSLALPRAQLAQVDGPGRFAPVQAFLEPVLAAGAAEVAAPAEALRWNTLQSRRIWLQRKQALAGLAELRLAVLQHPLLERIATRMQAQWNRTLNLNVRVLAVPIDQIYRALPAGDADLLLDVVDLDDGSLQDLWLEALRALGTPLGAPGQASAAKWEAALRGALPYLPVLGNIHAVLLRPDPPTGLLQRACPGCVPTGAPGRLAPEATEREDPRG